MSNNVCRPTLFIPEALDDTSKEMSLSSEEVGSEKIGQAESEQTINDSKTEQSSKNISPKGKKILTIPKKTKKESQASAQKAKSAKSAKSVKPSAKNVAQEQTKVVTHAAEQIAQKAKPAPVTEKELRVAPLTPSEVDFMPGILRSMATLMRLRGKIVSPQFLLAELAGSSQITIGACLRAMQRAGMQGKVFHKENLSAISPLTLPCVLLLKNDMSCVLTELLEDEATIILPESSECSQRVSLEQLEDEFAGYAVFAAHEKRTDARSEKWHITKEKQWFWGVLRYYAPIYRHVAFASIVVNIIATASPLFAMNVYDRVVPNNAVETLWVLASGIILAYILDFILKNLRHHFVDIAGRNADVVLSSMLMEKVLTMKLDVRPDSTGAIVNNIREFESLRDFFSSSTLLTCIDIPFLIIFYIIIYIIGGPLVILPILAIPVLLSGAWYFQTKAKKAAEESYKHNMQRNALLVEMVSGVETIKTCIAESRMQRLWEAVSGISAQTASTNRQYTNRALTFSTLITQLVTVSLIIVGVYLISAGEMTMGGLIGTNMLVGGAMAPLLQMAGLLSRFQNSRVSLSALDTLMQLESENQDEKSCMDFGTLDANFVMSNVTFSYPSSEKHALHHLNLSIKAGEKVGIIGRMGSGKSTIGKMLTGLYTPQEGAITFGGVDIRQLSGAELRSRIGVLSQDVTLFYGTIRDNIAMGDPTINDHLILRASSLAGVADFVKQNPSGFGAQVGEQGKALSGGQRQAVGLARALVRDPEVLILDEPTSNMDTDAELQLQKRLHSIVKDKTLVLITHRLSMLRLVDRVVVIDNGKVSIDGPRDSVLQALQQNRVQKTQKEQTTKQ